MKRVLPIALCIGAMLIASSAFAQAPNLDARFALHAIPTPTGKVLPSICPPAVDSADPVTQGIPCTNYVTAAGAASSNWVYLVLVRGEQGFNGASFGVEYQGLYEPGYLNQANWSLCSDGLDFPSGSPQPEWPTSGSGMLLTWGSCPTTVVGSDGIQTAVAKFYIYGYGGGHFQITPNNTKSTGVPELDLNTCGLGTTRLLVYTAESLWDGLTGRIDFGGGPGRNPCLIVPTEDTSWGRLKTLFNN